MNEHYLIKDFMKSIAVSALQISGILEQKLYSLNNNGELWNTQTTKYTWLN